MIKNLEVCVFIWPKNVTFLHVFHGFDDLFFWISLFQVYQRFHQSPQRTLPRERILPGLCSLLLPDKSAQKSAQERSGQELADTSRCSHRGGEAHCFHGTLCEFWHKEVKFSHKHMNHLEGGLWGTFLERFSLSCSFSEDLLCEEFI